jgi:hypothetical protein
MKIKVSNVVGLPKKGIVKYKGKFYRYSGIKPMNTKGKTECKHKWTIIPYRPQITIFTTGSGGGSNSILNDAIAICSKCFEKRYL